MEEQSIRKQRLFKGKNRGKRSGSRQRVTCTIPQKTLNRAHAVTLSKKYSVSESSLALAKRRGPEQLAALDSACQFVSLYPDAEKAADDFETLYWKSGQQRVIPYVYDYMMATGELKPFFAKVEEGEFTEPKSFYDLCVQHGHMVLMRSYAKDLMEHSFEDISEKKRQYEDDGTFRTDNIKGDDLDAIWSKLEITGYEMAYDYTYWYKFFEEYTKDELEGFFNDAVVAPETVTIAQLEAIKDLMDERS